MTEKKFYVYQLRCEDDDLPRYVGKGKGRRAKEHFDKSRLAKEKSYKSNWIRKCYRDGKKILIEVLENNLTEQESLTYEKFFISAYGRLRCGGCLTNLNDGGVGNSGHKLSEETKKKISVANTGRSHSEDSKRRMREAKVGQKLSEASLKKLSASLRLSPRIRGENNSQAKLTADEVVHIHILMYEGMADTDVGAIFSVDRKTISDIRLNKSWQHLLLQYTGPSSRGKFLTDDEARVCYTRVKLGERIVDVAESMGKKRENISALIHKRSRKAITDLIDLELNMEQSQ